MYPDWAKNARSLLISCSTPGTENSGLFNEEVRFGESRESLKEAFISTDHLPVLYYEKNRIKAADLKESAKPDIFIGSDMEGLTCKFRRMSDNLRTNKMIIVGGNKMKTYFIVFLSGVLGWIGLAIVPKLVQRRQSDESGQQTKTPPGGRAGKVPMPNTHRG
jgi:hypothetical protein